MGWKEKSLDVDWMPAKSCIAIGVGVIKSMIEDRREGWDALPGFNLKRGQ